ncbi:MAG: YicC/YloC family endoribonuclease [Pseudomonadota bacterium]|nr:YicC/YloC family endoribonuclease [Pseudomonadota bacterium]MDP1905927.1 YicC/YloC family endoribonuclease [Pseudomonadota bacterium]MDP2353605.1 YicC/YloC family endoribonuclease [Pseudomonadota bacterium]
MTGYAAESADIAGTQVTLELRAVNSRFLDLTFRMGEDFRAMEPALRERITNQVKRGKLECRLNLAARPDAALPTALNSALLDQLGALSVSARRAFPEASALSVAEILRWPGMLGDNNLDTEALHAGTLAMLERALTPFNASRAREGDKLKAIILDRLQGMREHVARIRPRTPEIVAAYRDKLRKRLEELLPTPDHDRIHQEVALFAQKIDIDEELDRLLTHLDEVERVLDNGGAAGKRLDFLMQELNREANTLGSKSVSLELTQTSVELKVLIEQMREQIQNIE